MENADAELSVLVGELTIDDTFSIAPTPTPIPSPAPTPAPAPAPVPVVLSPSKKRDRGSYIMEEDDLPEDEARLLHGRAFVTDIEVISETDPGSPHTYYIAYDQVQGLVVPARSLVVENNGVGGIHYRWTDDGEKWTSWITLSEGSVHDYEVDQKCRFAEVQVYADSSTDGAASVVATR